MAATVGISYRLQLNHLIFLPQVEVAGGWRRMAATVGISYRLQLNHLNSEKKPVRSECLAFQVQDIHIKGTWQRGGFSGVFAEIGSA